MTGRGVAYSERRAFVELRKTERARAVESLKQREIQEREEQEKRAWLFP